MRSIALAGILLLSTATAAVSQAEPNLSGDAAVTYHWVRTNTQPGACGCIDLNGGRCLRLLEYSSQGGCGGGDRG